MTPFAERLWGWLALDRDAPIDDLPTVAGLIADYVLMRRHDETIPENVGAAVREAVAELIAYERLEQIGDGLRWKPLKSVAAKASQRAMF